MNGTEQASGLQQLKYFPKNRELRSLVLAGSGGNNYRLTPRRVARLAAGTPEKFYGRQKKAALIGTAIVTVLITALMAVLVLVFSNATGEKSAMGVVYVIAMTVCFFASAAIMIPIVNCFAPSRLDYGQNPIDEVRQHRVKRIRAWLFLPFFGALIGTIVCAFVAAGSEKITFSSASVIFWLIFYAIMACSASLFFLLKNMEESICPSCKMVNTVFTDHGKSYGREERRLVSTGSHSATIGKVYDSSGAQVGTVSGQVQDYGYEVGRSYTWTEVKTCACCGHKSFHQSDGYERIRIEKE